MHTVLSSPNTSRQSSVSGKRSSAAKNSRNSNLNYSKEIFNKNLKIIDDIK